jgi:hypothetical protein
MAEVCQLLVAKGADVNHIDGDGHPLLWKAFAKDDVATAQLLLAKGAAVRSPDVDYGDETLLFASLQGTLVVPVSHMCRVRWCVRWCVCVCGNACACPSFLAFHQGSPWTRPTHRG